MVYQRCKTFSLLQIHQRISDRSKGLCPPVFSYVILSKYVLLRITSTVFTVNDSLGSPRKVSSGNGTEVRRSLRQREDRTRHRRTPVRTESDVVTEITRTVFGGH